MPATAPVDNKAARTRRRIVDAAAGEFAENGYGGASLRRIATAAGLQLGSLYFHFKTKDELVIDVLAEGVESARAALKLAVGNVQADASPEDRLRAAIRGHLDALHASDDRASSVVRMVETLPPDLRRVHAEHERRFAQVWSDILKRGQADGVVRTDITLRILRDLVIGALNSTSTNNPAANKDLTAITDAVLVLLHPSPAARGSGPDRG
ncbi:TetR/AcrR family transcriptional regulator [Nocardioides immobilis]|uniref:TetR/AcrR family transcriptional regulator n=1 Tax=Nocardioides immobilis TaxID=2049295 RepID=A0A417XTK2_9ACTN|nr:TetR/AcrR family transcriptional regulator [Nocardioides immobilis]RHW23824.1 TetR/AcrR family transcriptional regulator [Nocardioides immobilis]